MKKSELLNYLLDSDITLGVDIAKSSTDGQYLIMVRLDDGDGLFIQGKSLKAALKKAVDSLKYEETERQ